MQPPPSIGEIQHCLAGAWKLFRRDPAGATHFGTDATAFWKSFWCAAVVAPPFAILLALIPADLRIQASVHRTVIVEVIAYSVGWTAWPLLAHWLSGVFNFQDRYIPYIVAYNWSAGPQICVLLAVFTVGSVTSASLELVGALNLIAVFWLLIYHGYIIRSLAGVGGGVVFVMVLLELLLGVTITWARDFVLLGGALPA